MLENLQPYHTLIGEHHLLWQQKLPDQIVKLFIDRIDELETLPVNIQGKCPHQDLNVDYTRWIEAIKTMKDQVNTQLTTLQQRLDGLKYRISQQHGGKNLSETTDTSELIKKLVEWKKLPAQFNLDMFDITEKEKEKLEYLTRYTSVANRVLENQELQEKMFHWLFRLNGDVDLFIEFPKLAEKMTSSHMQDWVGYIDHDVVKVEVTDGIKTVQMKFMDDVGQKKVSLLDDKKVIVLERGLELSIADIFKIHVEKETVGQGLGCFFRDGFRNWNSRLYGQWNKDQKTTELIDLNAKDWMKQLPIVKKLTAQEAKDKYGEGLGEGETIAAFTLCATTETPTPKVNVDKTHAYNDMVLSVDNGDNYVIYSFGRLGNDYPENNKQVIGILFKYLRASIVYPEENPTIRMRQNTWTSTLITAKVVEEAMGWYTEKVKKARAGQLGIQLFCSACSSSSEKVYNFVRGKMNLPEIKPFDIHFTAIDATGFIEKIIKAIKCLPHCMQNKGLSLVFLIGRPGRKTTFTWNNKTKNKACWNHERWNSKMVKAPSLLFRFQKNGDFLPEGKLKPGFLQLK